MTKRSWVALLLALLLAVPAAGLAADKKSTADSEQAVIELDIAQRPVKTEPVHINVGSATKVSGNFFADQLGNNTSDIDVRNMIYGYSPVYWSQQELFEQDPIVVKDLQVKKSKGNTVYTITLNKDLYYNDGVTKVTAYDYAFSFLLLTSKELTELGAAPGAYAYLLGYEDYNSGKKSMLSGVRVLDDYTFSVTVKKSYTPFFYEYSYINVLPYPISVIAPGCVVTSSTKGVSISNIDKKVKEPIFSTELLSETIFGENGYMTNPVLTTGPYSLVGYNKETGDVDFEINPFYKGNWDGVKPYIDTVTLKLVQTDTMVQDLENGRVDVLNKCVDGDVINGGMALVAKSNGTFTRTYYARLGYGFLSMACEKGPQQFQKVRQALACCFDRDQFVTDFLKSYGTPVYSYYGLGQWMVSAANNPTLSDDMTDKEIAIAQSITLDNLDHYDYDLDRAQALLEEDGWVLNEMGEAFNPEKDTVRCKLLKDGQLMKLSFSFALCRNNAAAQKVLDMLTEAFKVLHAEIQVTEVDFVDMLADCYKKSDRVYDLYFRATNFLSVFDPYTHFVTDERYADSMNTSGIQDKKLVELAWDMHATQPGDDLGYLQKWQLFEERFNEVLPTIPIYSNMYFDFHINALKDYNPGSEYCWPVALLYSYVDYSVPEAEEETAETEGEVFEDEESFEDDEDVFEDDEETFED